MSTQTPEEPMTGLASVKPRPHLLTPDGWIKHGYMDAETLEAVREWVQSYGDQRVQTELIKLHSWVMKASDPIARQNLFKYIDDALAALPTGNAGKTEDGK